MIVIPAGAPVTILRINHIIENRFLGMAVTEHDVRAAVMAIRRPLLAQRVIALIVLCWVQVRAQETGRPAVCEHYHFRRSHDITACLKKNPGAPHEIRVRLDEKVGHNTQGFLPFIEPHFGGLWQRVSLLVVPETYLDDLQLMASGDAMNRELRIEVPLAGKPLPKLATLNLRCRLKREQAWQVLAPMTQRSNDTLQARVIMPQARLWSPAGPSLYEVEVSLPGKNGDTVRAVTGFRSLEAYGQEFRLNGKPLSIRGVLNWGYSPPLLAPNPGEAAWRAELELVRSQGFNLMKFCLWIPPQRYLELADEMGMLIWVEYPSWHSSFTEEYLPPLRHEFTEFFQYDRNHPSVILRSLTCETGPSAELKVIQNL